MANPKSKKRKRILILSLIVLVLGGLTAAALMRKREPVFTVQTEKVTRRNLTELVVANGRVYPVVQVKISQEVSGEIIALPVKEGQVVKKGDLLLKIKPDLYTASVNSSEAGYRSSLAGRTTGEANLRKAQLEFERHENLLKSQLISESTFLEVKTMFEVAKAQLESASRQVDVAKAAMDRAAEDLRKTTIFSPIDGTVSQLRSQLGERVVGTAMMAGTEIMTIADLNEMEARVDIGEIDVVLIALGQTARLEVDAFRDRKFAGAVSEIANASKNLPMGGMGGMGGGTSQEATKFEVKIRIKDKEVFRPGMSVTAEIETRSRTNVLCVPIASVTTRAPKPPGGDKKPATAKPGPSGAQAATSDARAKTNAAPANAASNQTSTVASGNATNAPAAQGTNSTQGTAGKKQGEAARPIEVVFLKDGERAKMVPVKRGISDDSYTEITEGVADGQEVVAGGYKVISKDLEEGKKVQVGPAKGEAPKEKR